MNTITTFLGNILRSGVFKLGGFEDKVSGAFESTNATGYKNGDTNRDFWVNVVTKLAKIADWLVPTIMIIIGMVGAVYMTVIGIKYAKAEGEEQKNESKKKLVNAGIGMGVALLIMIVLLVILSNADSIAAFVKQTK